MLNLITKALVGVAIGVTATIAVATVIEEKNKKKYAEVGKTPEEVKEILTGEIDPNDKKISTRIRRAARKMVDFITDHQREIAAVTAIIGLADAFVTFNKHKSGTSGVGFKKQKTKVIAPAPAPVVNNDPTCWGGVLEWADPGKEMEGSAFVEVLEEDRENFINLLSTTGKNCNVKWEVL